MKNLDENGFINSIKTKKWDIVYNYNDVNDALEVWKELFNSVCDIHAPINERLVKGAPLPEWISRDFIQLTKDRDYFYKRLIKLMIQMIGRMLSY